MTKGRLGARVIFQLRPTVKTSFITLFLGKKGIFTDSNQKLLNNSRSRMSNPVLDRAAPSERNKEPILQILKNILKPLSSSSSAEGASPDESTSRKLEVLEIASGTGQHVAHFAPALPHTEWQPSEVTPVGLNSIQQYIQFYGLTNVKPPILIDVTQPVQEWPAPANAPNSFDAIQCTNMIHITPWSCTEGLFSAAGYLLRPGGHLITYGPYAVGGVLTPDSNFQFDASLRQRNPLWGIRDVEDLIELGEKHRLQLVQTFDMPANNKILLFSKTS